MDQTLFIAALVSMAGVVISMVLGFRAMAKGSQQDHKTSQRMMRMRVFFQAMAVLFLFLAYVTK